MSDLSEPNFDDGVCGGGSMLFRQVTIAGDARSPSSGIDAIV